MGTFLAALILFGCAALSVNAQTCLTSYPPFANAAIRQANQLNPNQYFVIGGLFDVHNKGNTAYECSTMMSDLGFINMLAFFWGIDRFVNRLLTSTASVSVGAVAFDSCMRTDQTIEYVYGYAQCRININNMDRENLVAYVGPYRNDDAERTGILATDLGITVFSPMADSPGINSIDQKTLLRMRPSFTYDLTAIVAFLNKMNAGFVIILYSGSDPYWKNAYEELTRQIRSSNASVVPCIQYTADFDSNSSSIIERLAGSVSVKYIVPLMSRDKLNTLMSAMNAANIMKYIFILTSRIGQDIDLLKRQAAVANNTIVVDFALPGDSIMRDFNNFLLSLNKNVTLAGLGDGVGNKWVADYTSTKMPPQLNISSSASPLILSVYRTLQSVQAIIQGMNSVIQDCGRTSNAYQFCGEYRNQLNKNEQLFSKLKAALTLNNGELKYTGISYTYNIFTVDNSLGSTASFYNFGRMNVADNGMITYDITDLRTLSDIYKIVFSEPSCPTPGSNMCCEVLTTTIATTTTTTAGPTGASSFTTPVSSYIDVQYPRGQVITGAYANAPRMDSEYGTRFDLGHMWIIALGVLAGLGILCVIIFEIYILYKMLGTGVESKWRTMWLGQLLLFGIFLCYLVLFAYLPIPTKATCGITRFGVGVSYAFCFAVLLVKLMVILTSKPSDVLLPGDIETPNYLKGIYQFLMFIFALGVQIVIDVQWLITVPPEAVLVTSNNNQKIWICNHYTWEVGPSMNMYNTASFVRTNFENHLMSLIYIMLMILITTILSLRSHGIITNHRESIFIGIASGFTIPIWLAWGLVGGLNKNNDYSEEFGDACIAFGLLITATLILFAMFLPKVRHLVNMGIEGIYLEDDRETVYGGSVILAPPSYKSKGSGSVIIVNNQGIYSEPVVVNGDPMATHLKHPGSIYSVPVNYMKNPESAYGGSARVLRVTDDLRGRHPQKRSQSEVAYGASRRPRSHKGTLPRSRSQTNLGAL